MTAPAVAPSRHRTRTATLTAVATCAPTDPADASGAAASDAARSPVTDWFDVDTVLGRRGYKYLPLASQLALAAGRRALAALPAGQLESIPTERRTAWVACAQAAASIHAGMDDVVRADGADLLSPLGAPYFSINLVGARLATELVAHGGVTTFTTPGTAGFDALAAACRSVATDQSDLALVVVVEVAPPAGESGHANAEVGALALVITPADERDDGAGGPPLPAVRVVRAGWTAGTLGDDLDHALAELDAVAEAPVVLVRAGDAVPAAVAWRAGTRRAVTELDCGAGAYRPVAAVVDAAQRPTGDAGVVVLVAAPAGRLAALTLQTPSLTRTHGAPAPAPTEETP